RVGGGVGEGGGRGGGEGGGGEAGLAGVEAVVGQLVGRRRLEVHGVAVGTGDAVAHEVDVEPACERHAHDGLGRADERERVSVAVVPAREVAVVRRHDRVAVAHLDVVALPLPAARTT